MLDSADSATLIFRELLCKSSEFRFLYVMILKMILFRHSSPETGRSHPRCTIVFYMHGLGRPGKEAQHAISSVKVV